MSMTPFDEAQALLDSIEYTKERLETLRASHSGIIPCYEAFLHELENLRNGRMKWICDMVKNECR